MDPRGLPLAKFSLGELPPDLMRQHASTSLTLPPPRTKPPTTGSSSDEAALGPAVATANRGGVSRAVAAAKAAGAPAPVLPGGQPLVVGRRGAVPPQAAPGPARRAGLPAAGAGVRGAAAAGEAGALGGGRREAHGLGGPLAAPGVAGLRPLAVATAPPLPPQARRLPRRCVLGGCARVRMRALFFFFLLLLFC